MNVSAIDTSTMLTMLGIVAAVWALVPGTAKLSFRLSLSWWDWAVIWGIVTVVHILMFEEVLRALHLYPNLGPWKWGFDKSGVLYLLFVGLAVYIYLRAQNTHLNRRNLPLFERLVTSLVHARKFEELATLLDHHIEAAFAIANATGVHAVLVAWLRPKGPGLRDLRLVDGQLIAVQAAPPSWIVASLDNLRERLADAISPSFQPQQRARSVIRTVLSSRDMVAYLAVARPYLCVRVMLRAEAMLEDFQDEFFEALLASESSIFYSELKNNHNLAGGHRLALPSENRLLSFYLKDVKVAARLGVFRSLGEAMLSRIDSDDVLGSKLNGPMLTYQEVGEYRCPIYCGIHFFRIMVFEGLYQRIADHFWLHYVTHFVGRMLARARPVRPEDENYEFATPMCYLLYEVVDVTTDWIEEAASVTAAGDIVTPDAIAGQHIHISFEATEALGGVMQTILSSDRITRRLKEELLQVVLHTYERIAREPQLDPLARVLVEKLIRPYGFAPRDGHIEMLADCYRKQDHILKGRVRGFEHALRGAGAML